MKKIKLCLMIIALLLMISVTSVRAAYVYDPNGNEVPSAESLTVTNVIDSSNLTDLNGNILSSSVYQFGSLYDVFVFENRIYLVDNTNSVIVVLNSDYQYLTKFPTVDQYQEELEGLDETDYADEVKRLTLSTPRGIYITSDYIYVCDYGNNRVVLFDHDYKYVSEITTPDDPAFSGYSFKPKKIAVDRTGRMYVIAEGINEGILDLDPNGEFSRYFGTNTVTLSAWEAFWLLFTSEEQRQVQGYNFGSSLANLCVDSDCNVYTVSSPQAGDTVVKKLNPKGSDILNRNGYNAIIGDVSIISDSTIVPSGTSNFVDIDVNEIGTYVVLDKTRGRIFGYDFEGSLLYTAGQLASAVPGSYQSGMFLSPEALTYFGEKILVVDSKNNNLVVFEFTTFGKLVNEATNLYYSDEYIQAANIWEQVLELNTNYYLAYAGIGKAQLRQGDYENAMVNLKLGFDEYNYSKAYQQIRYQKMSQVFPYVIIVVMAGCIFLLVRSMKKSLSRADAEEEGRE